MPEDLEKPLKVLSKLFGAVRDLVFFVLISVFFLIPGLYLLVLGVGDGYYGICSEDWPSAKGAVVDSDISYSSYRGVNSAKMYLKYIYTVEGVEYTCHRWRFDGHYPLYSSDFIKNFYIQYFDSEDLTIYYHPHKPGLSVLEPGFKSITLAPTTGGLLLLLLWYLIIRCSRIRNAIAAIPRYPAHLWKRGG